MAPALSQAGAARLLSNVSRARRAGEAEKLMQMENKTTRAEAGTAAIPSDPFLQACLQQKHPTPKGKQSRSLDEPAERRLNPKISNHLPGRDRALIP